MTGDDPAVDARGASPQALDACHAAIRAIQRRPGGPAPARPAPRARAGPRSCSARPRAGPGPRWWTACRSRARSARTRCRWTGVREDPAHLALLEAWMRSYRPEELFDERGAAPPRAGRARAHGRPPAGREPPRQRRPRAPAARPAGLRRLRAAGAAAGHRAARLDPPARQVHARHLHAQPRGGQLPPLLPGRDQLQPARRRVRGGAPLLRPAGARATTITWRRTAA